MSEESPTTQTETIKDENTKSLDDHWSDIELMNRASQASKQNFIDVSPTTTDQDAVPKNKSFNKGVAVGVIAATAVGGLGIAAYTSNQGPEFSETTNEYVVQPGDGLYNAAEEIKGIDTIDVRDAVNHISVDPSNIDVLKDGLQAGETLVIPDSVK